MRSARRVPLLTALNDSPEFRHLLLSDFLFYAGIWTQTFILAWLAYELTASPFLMAVFGSVRFAPLLLGPLGGVLAERVDRVRLLQAAQWMVLATVLLTAVLIASGYVRYEHLLVAAFVSGLGHSPTQPARFTLVMDFVGARSISNANALSAVVATVTAVIAPVVGGVMMVGVGVVGALLISASWNALALVALGPLRGKGAHGRDQVSGRSALRGLLGGVRIAIGDARILGVLGVNFVANVLIFPVYQSFMPVFAKDVFHQGVAGLSWMMGSVGFGSLLGSLVLASMGDFRFKGAVFLIGTGVFGALFAAFANAPTYSLALVCVFLAGLGSSAFTVMQGTLLLLAADEAVRARVMGLQVLAIGALPVAAIGHGFLADAIGVVATTTIAGTLLAASMLALWVYVPSIRTIK